MRWLWLTIVLVLAGFSPAVSAVPLTQEFEPTDHLSSYSRAVQLAYQRCADLPSHDGTWLVVSEHSLGEPTPLLANSWLVDASASTIVDWQSRGIIEIACPQINRQLSTKLIPVCVIPDRPVEPPEKMQI